MSNSDSSDSYAEVTKRIVVVKSFSKVRSVKVKVPKFSPIKANQSRALISSNPSFKRKRIEFSSISPIKTESEVQKVKDDVMDSQYLKYSVRKRKNMSLNKSRRAVSSKIGQKRNSASTQTEAEENELIAKYIYEVEKQNDQRADLSLKLQLEKEKTAVLRNAMVTILDRAEISIENVKNLSENINQAFKSSKNPDLSTPAAVAAYHAEISRGIHAKKQTHTQLLSSMKSITLECHAVFTDLKRRHKCATKKKHPWSSKTNSCRTISQSSSNHSLEKARIDGTLVKYLRAPKSVQFKVPLNEYLSNDPPQTSASLNKSEVKIEIEIPGIIFPKIVTPVQNSQKAREQNANIEKFRNLNSENIDFSLLNISQSSTSSTSKSISQSNIIDQEWNNFAASNHQIVEDDDVNELLDYSSDDNVEDNSDVESLLNYDSADDE